MSGLLVALFFLFPPHKDTKAFSKREDITYAATDPVCVHILIFPMHERAEEVSM